MERKGIRADKITKFYSMVAPEIVNMTTYGVASDKVCVQMTMFPCYRYKLADVYLVLLHAFALEIGKVLWQGSVCAIGKSLYLLKNHKILPSGVK